jgi:hypothetical protein
MRGSSVELVDAAARRIDEAGDNDDSDFDRAWATWPPDSRAVVED